MNLAYYYVSLMMEMAFIDTDIINLLIVKISASCPCYLAVSSLGCVVVELGYDEYLF